MFRMARFKVKITLRGSKCLLQISIPQLATRGLQTSFVLCRKHRRAGIYKVSKNQSIPLTYEQAKPPYAIGVDKSWLTWNTSNLKGEGRKSETTVEDVFIRNFMHGTWTGKLASEVVIKRRHNMIFLGAYINFGTKSLPGALRIYFLIGYTEELLSCLLKCPVKLELQTLDSDRDLIFKYV
ncbi:28S ribosomal protein S24, mitochondrial-like isoform X1 [Mercenaria mercenaria]|uniref:28S ribosomal protein S24, mitochondrial-like isoform X1 n=1 Tax=Mercenaria mercenaria TaxID=6596 RepID=UPI00234EAA49|nr:28S ribosomal protein S24, mitochondrial-like isoform X1 [Mercenaria mercenaria]